MVSARQSSWGAACPPWCSSGMRGLVVRCSRKCDADRMPMDPGSETRSLLEIPRIERHGRVISHVNPDVHVRMPAEVPDERRAFEPPIVPFAVVADVAVLVEREPAFIE